MSKKVDENKLQDPMDSQPGQLTDPAHQAIATDQYAGQGGSYIFDPATKTRTKVD